MLGVYLAAAAAFAGSTIAERKTLTLEGARQVVAAVIHEAKKNNATGVVAVVDAGGRLVALERVDGTFAAGANVAVGKARTAALFQKDTKFFEELINKGRTAMTTVDFTPQGGVPIVIEGQLVGAVGVSGASNAAQDTEFAMSGAAALASGAKAAVSYFDASKVKESFSKGAVLFDNSSKYMVHTSRRDKGGLVEVHEDDADIVYVQQGKATLITGGELRNGKTIAPGEIRGEDVAGGETRELSAGDVVIIPAGTPHWFKEVTNPFTYYVVKAR
jgi:glc operon protein GlcG